MENFLLVFYPVSAEFVVPQELQALFDLPAIKGGS